MTLRSAGAFVASTGRVGAAGECRSPAREGGAMLASIMSNDTRPESLALRVLQAVADAAQAHKNGIANIYIVGDQLGLDKEVVAGLYQQFLDDHLVKEELLDGVVSVT